MTAATDEELLQALRAGDKESLGLLVLRWEQPLFRFVYRLLMRPEDARDVCQETFLRILKKSDRFKAGSRFSTWMYQIALNLCRDQLRRRKRWGLLLSERREVDERLVSSSPPEPGTDPARSVEQMERSAAVLKALKEIPAQQREVLVLKEFEGLKFREIAAILNCPESTVKSRLYNGLSGLRTVLERHGIEGP